MIKIKKKLARSPEFNGPDVGDEENRQALYGHLSDWIEEHIRQAQDLLLEYSGKFNIILSHLYLRLPDLAGSL